MKVLPNLRRYPQAELWPQRRPEPEARGREFHGNALKGTSAACRNRRHSACFSLACECQCHEPARVAGGRP